MKKFYTLLSLLITFALSTNLTAQTCSDGGYQWSDAATIFENNGCATADCHGSGSAGGLDLISYAGFATGGTKCGTQIFSGTTLVDIIQMGAACEANDDDDGGMVGAMNNNIPTPVSQSDIDALQAYIDSGGFEFCRGTPSDDGFDSCASTIDAFAAPAETAICTDGSSVPTLTLPASSLPDVQVVVEVNEELITVSDDGSFDYAILNAGDEVCYTAFTYDLAAIQALLETANGLCPTLDILFPDLLPCGPIGDLIAGNNDGNPGLNDLLEVLDFAASLSSEIGSVQSATSVIQTLNETITPLNLGPICFATSNNICVAAEDCNVASSSCPTVYLNDDNLPSLPDALCEGELLSLCFDLLVDETTFDASLIEFNYQLTFDGADAAVTLQNSFSAGTQIDANANGQICFETTIPEGPDPCQPFEISLTIESVYYRDDATCPSGNIGFALNLSALPASEGDDLNSLVPLLGLAGFNPLTLTGYPNPNWTATVTQAPACDGSTLGVVEVYASNGTLCETVSDLGMPGADGECPANNAELPEYTYAAFETFTVPDQNEMDSVVVNPCAISIVVPAQTTTCVENCGPCVGDEVAVTFSVDMSCSGTDMRPPVVTGPFNDWSGDGNIMEDPDGDDIWEAVICAVPGTEFEYKYATLNFTEQEELIDDAIAGGTCTPVTDFFSFANRQVTISADTGALPTDAYGICGTCENPPVNVTFSVNMNCSDISLDVPETSVAMFGGFNGFCCPLSMEDPDGDNIWTRTLPFPPDDSGCISMQYLYTSTENGMFGTVEAFLSGGEDIANCSNISSDYYSYANRVVETCADVVLDDHWDSCSAPAEPADGCDDGDCSNGTETWDGCSCVSGEIPTLGCTDATANNYDATAACDDGSCMYDMCEDACAPNFGAVGACDAYDMTCNTDCTTGDIEEWDATACACAVVTATVLGCTDATANNFDANANCDDDSCMYDMCEDACAPNFGAVGACDTYDMTCNTDCTTGDIEEWDATSCSCIVATATVAGCTDEAATNFDANANCDDGSCTYLMCEDPCAPNFEAEGACETYDMTCNTDCTMGDTEEWDSTVCACAIVTASVLGCTDETATNYSALANCDDGTCTYLICEDPCAPNFEAEGACETYDMTCPDDTCTETYIWDTEFCECIVAVIDYTCDDENECTNDFLDETTCECVNEEIPGCGVIEGCTDPCSPNYNSEATIDDGSCDAVDPDCNSDCTMGDIEIWNTETCSCEIETLVILGCTDSTADNYDPDANCDDGSCSSDPERVCPTPGVIDCE